ncbi:MAG TPA: ChaB family protein [Phormidium sp.]
MAQKQLDDLSPEVREQLTDGSEQYFLAAFNSASENGMSEEAAMNVAWNSLDVNFEKGQDGKWHKKSDEPGIHNKAVTSGGN